MHCDSLYKGSLTREALVEWSRFEKTKVVRRREFRGELSYIATQAAA
jgi:hypothetical protein